MGIKAKQQIANHIPLTDVNSSQISRLGFDGNTNTLAVEFIGKPGEDKTVYHYFGVTPETFAAMAKATSIGNYFYANVKGKYDFQRIEPETELRKNLVDGDVVEQPEDEPQAA